MGTVTIILDKEELFLALQDYITETIVSFEPIITSFAWNPDKSHATFTVEGEVYDDD